jgi:NADH-quinone oxidoreductase subunit L
VYWLVGLVTAFITSFYMFRMWFLTFFGEYKGETSDSHGRRHDDHAHEHGHSGVHESPMVMLVPLMILAVLSIVGGWVGIGGRFEHFLAPVFQSGMEGISEATTHAGDHLEELLMLVSVAVAVLGFYFAWLLYYKKPQLPKQIADGLGSFYRAVFNKYYVDEIYATLLVKPLLLGSTNILWKGVDQGVIDAALDGSASGAREVSDSIRHMQSGNLRSYAGWIAAGAAAVIVYMIWMGTR